MKLISPVLRQVIGKEELPSPSEKIKLGREIGRYRLMLKRYNVGEIKFALADLLIGRGEAGDYSEAMKLFNEILGSRPKGYLLAKTLVGMAELAMGSKSRKEVAAALRACDKTFKILKRDYHSFFGGKAIVVKAELLVKRGAKGDRAKAFHLFDTILKEPVHWYCRARALVGKAELLEYWKPAQFSEGVDLCERALKLLKSRPHDYFDTKAQVIEAELRIKRNRTGDLDRAKALCQKVASDPLSHKDLAARAKLDLAEISMRAQAREHTLEVLEMEGLDPYIIKKARAIAQALRA